MLILIGILILIFSGILLLLLDTRGLMPVPLDRVNIFVFLWYPPIPCFGASIAWIDAASEGFKVKACTLSKLALNLSRDVPRTTSCTARWI